MTNPNREFYDKVTLELNVKELESLKGNKNAVDNLNKVPMAISAAAQ